jgi:hypothetical protein
MNVGCKHVWVGSLFDCELYGGVMATMQSKIVKLIKKLVRVSIRLSLLNLLCKFEMNQICSRSHMTYQWCFVYISSYRTPNDMKPGGLVHKFRGWFSIKKSTLYSIYSRSYAQSNEHVRVCKFLLIQLHCLNFISSCRCPIEVIPVGIVP